MFDELYDTVIIGGGIAGLYSALQLSKNRRVLVLEKKDYLGGRIYTHPKYGYECGGARFHASHSILSGLIRKYGLKTYPLPKGYDFRVVDSSESYSDANVMFDDLTHQVVHFLQKNTKIKERRKHTIAQLLRLTGLYQKPEISLWSDMFGYSSEIHTMNAENALQSFNNDFMNRQFHVVVGGLGQLIESMQKEIVKNGSVILTKAAVVDIKHISEPKYSLFQIFVTINQKPQVIYGQHCIVALAARALRSIPFIQQNATHFIRNTIKCVTAEPLLRIYAIYKPNKITSNVWFAGLKRTTTNSFLRHIIPINEKKGIIMISYTDGRDIKPFLKKNGNLIPDSRAKLIIHNELKTLFPERTIDSPIYFKMHLWRDGSHYWNTKCPQIDSKLITQSMLQPLGKNVPLYVCGEAFSQKQAWMEGALETARNVVKCL